MSCQITIAPYKAWGIRQSGSARGSGPRPPTISATRNTRSEVRSDWIVKSIRKADDKLERIFGIGSYAGLYLRSCKSGRVRVNLQIVVKPASRVSGRPKERRIRDHVRNGRWRRYGQFRRAL